MDNRSGYDNPFIADTYDFVVPYRERKDVVFFTSMARESGGPVLELGCGTGRILIPTAREGICITGLDRSPEMLRVCRSSLDREPDDLHRYTTLVQGDMRDFRLDAHFRLITAPFRVFHHMIEVDEQLSCLNAVSRHLEHGGKIVLDLFNPYLPYLYDKRFLEIIEEEPSFTLPNGQDVSRRSRLLSRNLHRQIIEIEFLYEWNENGQTRKQSHRLPMRYFFRYEIEHLLARTGFVLDTIYAD